MDLLDGPDEQSIHDWVKKIEKAKAKSMKKKGQLVKDHPSASTLNTEFFAKLMARFLTAPSSTPGSGIFEKILGTRYPFPNSKILDEYNKSIPITQVPAPYPPCTIAEKDLKPIKISEMQLETHHRGRKVLLHILSPPDRTESILAAAEDENGTGILLQLFQQPEEKQIPCNVSILDYKVCIVKDPFFQRAFDSDSYGPFEKQTAYYCLRIDHPGDIIGVPHGDKRIPEKWRGDVIMDERNSSSGYREKGNKAFRNKQWGNAHFEYTQALVEADTLEDKQLAHLNRSLTNLKLGRPAKALSDATEAYDPRVPSEKALFRHYIALYNLQRFEECEVMLQTVLDAFPDSVVAKTTMQRVKSRLQEERTGNYNFKQMYEHAKATEGPPLVDCATFSTSVEIRDSPGRGRGLFTTKSVSAGELLLVEKAFAYSFMDETRLLDQVTYMVVQKLYHDPDSLSAFEGLFDGGFKKVKVSECDGAPVVDSFLVEKVLSLNSFGSPRTTRDFCKNVIWSGKKTPSSRERPIYTSAGVWLLAARVNHSCVGNCRRSFIGDMQIIRAARDIPAGTELTFPYRASADNESYEETQEKLAKWGFVCDCELCKERHKTTDTVLLQRRKLHNDFMNQLPSDKPFDFDKATKLLKGFEKMYRGKPAKQIRWLLADLYGYTGIRCRQDGDFVEAAQMLIKALEAMGYVIHATAPGDARGQSRFEVKHWGMMELHIPWLFFQLIECYDEIDPQLVQPAEHYARLAYSIIVGEGESMWDVLSATGNQYGSVEEGYDLEGNDE
ncbi:hypothetical protein FPOA_06514 [Fusarium poae]|uniref:SET domain-containing protein n=1 Tax=Fusarium poae TaxID=36050 RepID=A0A1B8AZS4_FUSPO|nr:hypothetical protein FPOA_06514 [Fusarium poae]